MTTSRRTTAGSPVPALSGAARPVQSGAGPPAPALSAPLAAPGMQPGDAGTRLRLDLSYDGSGFHGWSLQPGLRTVQDVLQQALGRILALPGPAALTVAGRTDAGRSEEHTSESSHESTSRMPSSA